MIHCCTVWCSLTQSIACEELSVYGSKHIHTPNIDRLAKKGIVFDFAYAQIAGVENV